MAYENFLFEIVGTDPDHDRLWMPFPIRIHNIGSMLPMVATANISSLWLGEWKAMHQPMRHVDRVHVPANERLCSGQAISSFSWYWRTGTGTSGGTSHFRSTKSEKNSFFFSVIWPGGRGWEPGESAARDGGGSLGGRLLHLPRLLHAPTQVKTEYLL